MTWLQLVMVLYGLFDIAMGLIGTMGSPTHEPWSLLAGGLSGLLVIACAVLTKTKPRIGFIAATVIGLLVGSKFAPDAFRGQVFPALVIFLVSIAFAGTLVGAHFAAMSRRKRLGESE